MKSNKLVRDLKFETGNLGEYEPCIMVKLPQAAHRPVMEKITKGTTLELIHMDLCGPIPVTTLSGNKYAYVLINNYSNRYTSTYLIKTKDEAYEYFVDYMNKWENQLGKRIKSVRSDNGKEFVNERF
ncbi:hypothetical protein KPH14_008882 [Odynerus spinipes]|uniref:Integrase catalytic domain-containing protein n=1 Tax=Odynerus spinipes TaxID=1348599 RepID=A0AAD9VLC0_9HYME|nr:hypothetical protein KPH14_008882 [Odynerus spinipes]